MSEQDFLTPGEIGRSLRRIEEALARIEGTVGAHETQIAVLQSNKTGAIWVMGGLWSLLMVVTEWVLHRR